MPDESSASPNGEEGLLHLLPIPLKAGTQVRNLVVSLLPWGAPALSGIDGSDSSDEPLLVIGYEWPIPWARLGAAMEKRDLESFQLERYRTDHLFALGELPFVDARAGADPPDFVASTDGGSIGIECTTFAVSERREALGLFARIRRTLVSQPRADLAHLAGNMLYLWFGEEGRLERPFRSTDGDAVDELIEALKGYHPDPRRMATQPTFTQAPDPGAIRTSSGGSFYAVPFVMAVPVTGMFTLQGFELGLAFPTEHTRASVWQDLSRLAESHDAPGVDTLLVSIGRPNQLGQVFPSDEAVARFALDHPGDLEQTQHVSRIVLHFWATGEAWDLLPAPTRLFGPLYAGTAVGHQPLRP